MIYVLAIVLAGLMAMVLISLLRGLNAFRSTLDDAPDVAGTGPTELQLLQNRMMWSRIKYQALAIGVVIILLAVAR
jgi:Hypoxia induced protein conserved region